MNKTTSGTSDINGWLDGQVPVSLLQNLWGHSLREIDELSERFGAKRAPAPTISKFVNRKSGAPSSLPGVSRAMLHIGATTSTGIALRANLQAYNLYEKAAYLRVLATTIPWTEDAKSEVLVKLNEFATEIRVGRDVVARESDLIHELAPASFDKQGERSLDLGSLHYLDAQCDFYELQALRLRVRLYEASENAYRDSRPRLLRNAKNKMWAAFEQLRPAVEASMRGAEPFDKILGVNALANVYFSAYELDELAEDKEFSSAKLAAQVFTSPAVLSAARHAAVWQEDPRVAINAASAAGLAGHSQRAEDLIILSATLDRYEGQVHMWQPSWEPIPISESQELAIALLNIKKKNVSLVGKKPRGWLNSSSKFKS